MADVPAGRKLSPTHQRSFDLWGETLRLIDRSHKAVEDAQLACSRAAAARVLRRLQRQTP